jgi:hypothetical protein
MTLCLHIVSTLGYLEELAEHTFDSIPSLIVLVRSRIARWSASKPLDDQRIEIDHREVILEHILHAFPRDAR